MKRTRRDEQKQALDRKTSYMTLLPSMDEGFHSGYQSHAGVVSDGNQKPYEWLESVARNMLTPGEDVGYSIPDVLASEAQIRRLMRLPHEDAMRHQEMIDWRGTLAVLLLWDRWPQGETWPELTCENLLEGDGGAFIQSVKAALPADRAAFGLWLYTLTLKRDGVPERKVIGMLSPAVALTPAANPGDLSAFLPDRVRWYNRTRKRFEDPCPLLDEADRARLVQRLRFLQALNERAELRSPLYATDASLCGLIDRFISDLLAGRGSWRERLDAGEQNARQELFVRALAVYGLRELSALPALERRDDPLALEELNQNPLLSRLTPECVSAPAELGGASVITYAFEGGAFAVESPLYLLEPANTLHERDTLQRLWKEISLPMRFDADWNRALAKRFLELANHLTGRQGASRRVIELLREWSVQRANFRETGDRAVAFHLPFTETPATLNTLALEMIGMQDVSVLTGAFSDCLLLCDGMPPYVDPLLNEHCAVRGADNLYAVPPVGPALALWLARTAWECDREQDRPWLALESLAFDIYDDNESRKVRARIQLMRSKREGNATFQNRIDLTRVYTVGAEYAQGAAVPVPTRLLPTVRVWPAARLARGQWTDYYVLTQRPDTIDVVVPVENGFVQGEPHRAAEEDEHGTRAERRWQTTRTARWPLYVGLMRGKLSLGALPNEDSPLQLKREGPAAISVDFGSNATTVMLRQGDHIRPAALSPRLLKTLLQGRAADDLRLPDEFIPPRPYVDERRPSTFVSVMDMFGDDEQKWQTPLLDGHIFYAPDVAALLRKNPNALYYDLKWGEEPYQIRCLRLFLKQTMIQASLAARLAGSPSVSWRVSMPNAMPLHRQEAYLETVRALAREVAGETGVPLTANLPGVLFADENQADGLYFRSRNEVNARSGYLNMDVGGGTTDLSVWLGGATAAAAETSLLLGCRQILFDSLSSRRRDEFEADFATADDSLRALVREISRAFAAGENTLRIRQKNVYLMDSFFAEHSAGVAAAMEGARAQGRVSLMECLLLLNFGFLFRLSGELLDRCDQAAETRALLKPRMEICVAGNGGQFLNNFDLNTRNKLFSLALSGLNATNPVRDLLLVQSRHPKQEVAIGLLSDDSRMRSTVQGGEPISAAQRMTPPIEKRRGLLKQFVLAFYTAFPQAGERLMGGAFDHTARAREVKLTPSAEIELEAILDNEMNDQEEFASYVRAFDAMKRLWKI